MENFTKVLEHLGSQSSMQQQLVKRGKILMQRMGVDKRLAVALSQKKTKSIEKIIHKNMSLCCFIMVPPEVSNAVSTRPLSKLRQTVERYMQFEKSVA